MATATATLEHISEIDGALLARMVREGTARLRTHAQEVNNLNVFPIPDGDTGSNMLQTASGGADSITSTESGSIGKLSRRISDGMLLSARGNSGVILSQIFEGMARAFDGAETADAELIIRAMQSGTRTAYDAVMQPTEGTMLTVMRCATDYVAGKAPSLPVELLRDFISEAKRTLERTPDMLPVLKRAGVVDSGGAGLIYIAEGMLDALLSDSSSEENVDTSWQDAAPSAAEPDLDSFDENSKLEYGYCTELLLRLQRSKTDPETLRVESLTEWLSGIGDSVVAFKTGSIVKLHIHTKTPDRVLAFCQRYGEFLKVKIENMSLQHNSSMLGIGENTDYNDNDAEPAPSADAVDTKTTEAAPKKQFGIVVVASGEGVKQLFSERGADIVIDGGQSMNPSARDFIDAFREVSAQTVFVLPNNGNIILAAKQAAELYTDADIRVIECTTVGEGYAAISMFSDESGDADTIESELRDALGGVVTAGIWRSIRDSGEVKAGTLWPIPIRGSMLRARLRTSSVSEATMSASYYAVPMHLQRRLRNLKAISTLITRIPRSICFTAVSRYTTISSFSNNNIYVKQ